MRPRTFGLLVALVLACPSRSLGQVVQLPTYGSFSVSTVVAVPDRGAVFLGGASRAACGSISHGVPILGHFPGAGRLFSTRASGACLGVSKGSVAATVVDLRELDAAVLREAAARRGIEASGDAMARKAAFLSRHVARHAGTARDATERGAAAGGGIAAAARPAAAGPPRGAAKLLVLPPETR